MSSRKEENDRLHPKCDARARAGERRGIWIRYAASGVLVVAIVVAAITRTSGTSTSLSTLDLGLEVAQSTGLAVLALAGLGASLTLGRTGRRRANRPPRVGASM